MPMLITFLIGLAGEALPVAAAHAVAEVGHLVEHGVHVGHDVLAVDFDHGVLRRRSATCSTARRSVTLIFSPRNMASMRSARPDSLASCTKQLHRLVGDAVLRVVEIDADRFGGQALAALRIVLEELPQVGVLDLVEVLLEALSRRGGPTRARRWLSSKSLLLGIAGVRMLTSPPARVICCALLCLARAGIRR